MVNEPSQSANAIIAKALQEAGVPPREIMLPSESEQSEPVANPDGSLKGQVKGELEVEEPKPVAKSPELEPAESVVQPFGKADIEAAINQASSKFQSMMDGKINQLQYQMQQTVGALNQFFQAQEDTGIAGLPVEEQTQRRLDRLEKGEQPKIQINTQQPVDQQPAQFIQRLADFVDAVGLKIDDKRIDWAPDTNDPQVGFNRFLVSIKASLVEDQTKVIKELKDNGGKVLTNLRKKIGVDKVSTTGPGGAGLPDIEKMTPMQKIEYGHKVQEELSQINK